MSRKNTWKKYWDAYGGADALVHSYYLQGSFIVTIVIFPAWTNPGWWDTTVSILASMLGFTLGGFAIFVGFGDERFRKALSRSTNGKTPILLRTAASFVHFILVQMIALTLGVIVKFLYFPPPQFIVNSSYYLGINYDLVIHYGNYFFWFLGVFSFIYACACGIAATMWIFEFCSAYVAAENAQGNQIKNNIPSASETQIRKSDQEQKRE